MRVSVDPTDPGFRPWLKGCGVRVWLDGVEISCVITADEEAREILRAVTDERGLVIMNKARNDVVLETLRGTVRVELPPHIVEAIENGMQGPAIGKRQRIDNVEP